MVETQKYCLRPIFLFTELFLPEKCSAKVSYTYAASKVQSEKGLEKNSNRIWRDIKRVQYLYYKLKKLFISAPKLGPGTKGAQQ